MAITFNPITGQFDIYTDPIDDLTDVDTTTDPPALNETLKWDGSNWVPAAYDYEFEFSIASFADDQANTQEIGSGTWKTTGNINFTMTYNNGPPTAVEIILSSNGGVAWGSNLTVTSPFTSALSAEDTDYPNDKDKYIIFTLDADKGAENDTDTETVYFRNRIRWGASSKNTGWSSAEIIALSGSAISNDHTRGSMSISSLGGSDYVVFACPASYSNLTSINFSYNNLVIAMTLEGQYSVTNASGFTENYDVYVSDIQQPSGGDYTLESNESAAQNYMCWGHIAKSSGITESDLEGLSDGGSVISNSMSSRSMTITGATGSDYTVIGYPARLGALTSIMIGGFESLSDFTVDDTALSITNVNGYAENYRVYVSNNPGFSDPTEMLVTI